MVELDMETMCLKDKRTVECRKTLATHSKAIPQSIRYVHMSFISIYDTFPLPINYPF